jgi:hypothetical protein
MRSYEEFENLIYSCGDRLFSTVLSVTESREKTEEIIINASEKYLECHKHFKSEEAQYSYLEKKCRRLLKKPFPKQHEDNFLTKEERGKILTSAKLYINSGGKPRKFKGIVITAVVFVLVIAVLTVYKLNFMQSEEYSEGWGQWYQKEEQFREENGWGH